MSLKGFLLAVFDDKIGDDNVQRAVSKFHHHGGSKIIIQQLNRTLLGKYLDPFHEAVMEVATGILNQELDELSTVPELRLPSNMVTEDVVKDFSLALIVDKMKSAAPMLHDLLYALLTINHTKVDLAQSIVPTIGSILLKQRSRTSNYLQAMMGLFLFGTGSQKKVTEVLSRAGLSASVSTVSRLLEQLTIDARQRVQRAVVQESWFLVYDNINLAKRKYDQRLDNTDTFENGATATIVVNEKLSSLDHIQIDPSYHRLEFRDLMPDRDNEEHLYTISRFHLIDVLTRHYESLKKCSNVVPTLNVLPPERTKMYPLPAMHIDQSSVDGNLQILYHVVKRQLHLRPEWFERVVRVIVAGDQLTVSRLRSIKELREDDVSVYEWIVPLIQLFHLQMVLANTILDTHYGLPNEPGSLSYNIAMLRRKHVRPKDGEYHNTDELLRHTFDAMVIVAWRNVLETKDLDESIPHSLTQCASSNTTVSNFSLQPSIVQSVLIALDLKMISGVMRTAV